MILSLQSDVLYGAVGLKAGLPVYQASSLNSVGLATVTLAAHPGFGIKKRAVLAAADLADLLDEYLALEQRPALEAVHIGYLGAASQVPVIAEFITALKTQNPDVTILLDPVFGDGNKAYVEAAIITAVIEQLLPLATIITPNQFELGVIAGQPIQNKDTALAALKQLHEGGLRFACATGITGSDDVIADLLISDAGSYEVLKQASGKGVSGAGDAFAALFLASLMSGCDAAEALHIASTITDKMIQESKSPLHLNVQSGLSSFSKLVRGV